MTKLNRMMLIAKGQMPAPKSSCERTASSPNSAGQTVFTRIARVMKAVEVVMRAMKQPQKRTLSALEFIRIIPLLVESASGRDVLTKPGERERAGARRSADPHIRTVWADRRHEPCHRRGSCDGAESRSTPAAMFLTRHHDLRGNVQRGLFLSMGKRRRLQRSARVGLELDRLAPGPSARIEPRPPIARFRFESLQLGPPRLVLEIGERERSIRGAHQEGPSVQAVVQCLRNAARIEIGGGEQQLLIASACR